jgi:hypothetical protein
MDEVKSMDDAELKKKLEETQENFKTRVGFRETIRCLVYKSLNEHGINFEMDVARPKYNLDRSRMKIQINLDVDLNMDIERALENLK